MSDLESARRLEEIDERRYDTFPAKAITAAIGPIFVRFRAVAGGILRIPDQYSRFLVSEWPRIDCDVEVGEGLPPAWADVAVCYESGQGWEIQRRASGEERITYFTTEARRTRTITITHDAELAQVQARFRGNRNGVAVGFPIDEYVAERALARRGHAVLHACAVVQRGNGLVFTGHSGAGKSTMARIASDYGATILCDDRAILAREKNEIRVYGSPWHGTYQSGRPESASLRAVFLLCQDSSNYIADLASANGFGELFVRTIQPTGDPLEVRRVVDLLEELVTAVPVKELHFLPNERAYLTALQAVVVGDGSD